MTGAWAVRHGGCHVPPYINVGSRQECSSASAALWHSELINYRFTHSDRRHGTAALAWQCPGGKVLNTEEKTKEGGAEKKKTTGCKWNPECFKSIYLQGLSTGVLCNCVCWRNSCVIGTNIYFCLGTFWLALLYLVQWFYSVRSRRCDCCSCRFNEISWLHRFLMVAKWNSCVLVRLHCQEFYLIIPKYPSFLKQIWFRSTDNKKQTCVS